VKTGSLFLVALLKQACSYLTFIALNILLLKMFFLSSTELANIQFYLEAFAVLLRGIVS